MKALPRVKFLPFKGRLYGYDSPFGIPVMVLGESHYSDKEYEPTSLTRRVIKLVIEGEKWNFFTRAAAMLLGEQPLEAGPLWNSVVFYNYIQTAIKKNSRPTTQMWLDAEQPFREVLDWLNPRPLLIVVFGFQCWENTPCCGRNAKSIVHGKRKVECYEFGHAGEWSLAPKLLHPSRASPKEWHPIILKALARTGGHEFRF